MDFKNLNSFNVLVNTLSTNLLPLTKEKTSLSTLLKVYWILVWTMELVYLTVCILGLLYVPKERALQDSTVNILVSSEVIVMIVYLSNRKGMICALIEKLNNILDTDDKTLKSTIIQTLKPLEKPLKIYAIASVGTVAVWAALPLIRIFKQSEFHYVDYRIPAALSKEPFSISVFIGGVVLECLGSLYSIARKVSLDLYTMHLILLMTAQYKYLRIEFEKVLRKEVQDCGRLNRLDKDGSLDKMFSKDEEVTRQRLRVLTRHHGAVVGRYIEDTTLPKHRNTLHKQHLSPLLLKLHDNNGTPRFLTSSLNSLRFFTEYFIQFYSPFQVHAEHFEKLLVVLYAVGAVTQLYVLCFCIQQLLEASTAIMNDAFHAEWYLHNASFQREIAIMTLAGKLECRLSIFRNTDLTLPSFMSILNQAYSVCLLFLRARKD
ncbi:uncharacterized protein LOC128896758 isoform X1 [Hylaeus anthracinus]|uniref:uncharacterized protein LOC128896758 isoform X1 n=1 Tax=Hylaeus anthracinus TaxID=313031 RepID=UPI0023B94829|nr:uncharacterized protein LOC128896758 isoform X1 [Hylaeus anthracinus]